MNILLIHNYYKHRGGEDAVFENEKKALQSFGHKVIEYTRNNSEIDKYSMLQKIKFFFSALNNNKTVNDINTIILNNKIDLAHIHNIFPLISPSVYNILKKYKIKIIQTIHNYRFLCPNALFYVKNKNCRKCANGNYIHCIINRCYKNSIIFSILYSLIIMLNKKKFKILIDTYIMLTDFTRQIFVNYGYDKNKIYVKDNGYFKIKCERKKSKKYFLYLGRISREKGIDFLLECFAGLPDYQLIVAGTGTELDILKKRFKNKNIVFAGFINARKKFKLLEESNALIMPSVCYDNYPIAVIESFACGIPVIGSNIGGLSYIIENGKNGFLFNVNDFKSLRDKLKLLNNNENLRKKLGSNAKKTFLKRMEMTQNIKRLNEIYKKVLND